MSVRSLCVLMTLTGTSRPECCKNNNLLCTVFNLFRSFYISNILTFPSERKLSKSSSVITLLTTGICRAVAAAILLFSFRKRLPSNKDIFFKLCFDKPLTMDQGSLWGSQLQIYFSVRQKHCELALIISALAKAFLYPREVMSNA